jgi:hypothetical protein
VQIVVTDHQVLALWKEFNKSKVVKISALKVGMDRKTAAKYINSKILPSEIVKDRNWKTHPDKLEAIWPKAEEFLQENSDIEGKALFEHLIETYPNDIEENQLRTFQRIIKQWKIKQTLIIRGSKNFKSIDDYENFLSKVIDKANSKRQKKFDEEFPLLYNIFSHH